MSIRTTLSRRRASARRRASSRSVLAAWPALSFVLRGSTTHTAAPVGTTASTNAHVRPTAATASALSPPTPPPPPPRPSNPLLPPPAARQRDRARFKEALMYTPTNVLSSHGLSSSHS